MATSQEVAAMMAQLTELITQNKDLNERLALTTASLSQTREAAMTLETQTNAKLQVMDGLVTRAMSGATGSETKSMVDKGSGCLRSSSQTPRSSPPGHLS